VTGLLRLRAWGRALALLASASCTPGPLSASGPDASAAAATCANIARLDCGLGSDPACVSRLELSVSEQRVLASEIACAQHATSKAGLEACSPYFACP
jgi:hypothetical protein